MWQLYLLLVANIARTPYTGISDGPTRNMTSHISGSVMIVFKSSLNACVLRTLRMSGTVSLSDRHFGRFIGDEFLEASDSASELSDESYPDDASSTNKVIY